MQRYTINYFNQKTITYFGDKKGAIHYASNFADRLILSYVGEIVIRDEYGRKVATQKWTVDQHGCAYPNEWEAR